MLVEVYYALGYASSKSLEAEQDDKVDKLNPSPRSRPVDDLGECIVRWEDIETSLIISLLSFWAGDDVAALLERQGKKDVLVIGSSRRSCSWRHVMALPSFYRLLHESLQTGCYSHQFSK